MPLNRRVSPGGAVGLGDIRTTNRALVLGLLRDEGPLSRTDLARLTGLAKPTTSEIMEDLVADGLVIELGEGTSARGGGRRPVLYGFNPRAWFVIAVNVEVERTLLVLADAMGTEVARRVLKTDTCASDTMLAIGQNLAEMLRRERVARRRIMATSVVVPGLVDPKTGVCALAPNLGWRNVDIPRLLRPFLDRTPSVHNAVEAVLVAEHAEGVAKDIEDVVLLYEDSGVGAALLLAGRIHRGPGGLAGEIGHCKVPEATQKCACGAVGCLETEVSTSAILRRASLIGTRRRLDELRAIAASPDPYVLTLLREVGTQLGHAAAWVVNLVNPSIVVIAGGFLEYGPVFFDAVVESVRREALPELARVVDIRQSALGAGGTTRGAVLLALSSIEVRTH